LLAWLLDKLVMRRKLTATLDDIFARPANRAEAAAAPVRARGGVRWSDLRRWSDGTGQSRKLAGVPRARLASEREWSVHSATPTETTLATMTITTNERPVAGRRPTARRAGTG